MSQFERYLALTESHPGMFANFGKGEFTLLLQADEIRETEEIVAERLAKQNLPTEWAKIGIVYEDQYLFILRDAVRFPNGQLGTYIRIVDRPKSSTGVVMLPIYQQKVVLLRHFRHATRSWHLEIPRGFGEENSSSLDNARRELIEELEAEPEQLTLLGQMHVNTGLTSECVDLYLATLSTLGQADLNEGIQEVLLVEPATIEQMIRDNQITDSFTIAAYVRAKLNHLL